MCITRTRRSGGWSLGPVGAVGHDAAPASFAIALFERHEDVVSDVVEIAGGWRARTFFVAAASGRRKAFQAGVG